MCVGPQFPIKCEGDGYRSVMLFYNLPILGTRKQEEKIPSKTKLVLHQILTNGPDQKHLPNNFTDNSRKAFYNYRGKGEEQELVPPSYDFVDIDPRAIPYEKRENHEYYEDYAANDLREKGLYGVASGDHGLSRNRHKEFEAMNQQLQQFPGQKPGTSGQPQSAQYRPFSQQRGGQARPHKVAPETASGHNGPQQAGSQAQEGASQAAQQPKSQNRESSRSGRLMSASLAVVTFFIVVLHASDFVLTYILVVLVSNSIKSRVPFVLRFVLSRYRFS